jgi:hypothetical protein
MGVVNPPAAIVGFKDEFPAFAEEQAVYFTVVAAGNFISEGEDGFLVATIISQFADRDPVFTIARGRVDERALEIG